MFAGTASLYLFLLDHSVHVRHLVISPFISASYSFLYGLPTATWVLCAGLPLPARRRRVTTSAYPRCRFCSTIPMHRHYLDHAPFSDYHGLCRIYTLYICCCAISRRFGGFSRSPATACLFCLYRIAFLIGTRCLRRAANSSGSADSLRTTRILWMVHTACHYIARIPFFQTSAASPPTQQNFFCLQILPFLRLRLPCTRMDMLPCLSPSLPAGSSRLPFLLRPLSCLQRLVILIDAILAFRYTAALGLPATAHLPCLC